VSNVRRDAPRQPSMADVAARAGVAIGTVSNTLNRPDKVREPTRQRVLAAIAELGFVRNDAARSLAAGTSHAVGLVLADMSNSFFVDIARGAEAVMRESDMDVLIVNSDVDPDRELHNLTLLERTRVAGVLLAPLDTPLARAELLPTRAMPTVLVNYESPTGAVSGVVVNERHGGALTVDHLVGLGRRRLLFAGGPLFLTAVRERRDGALSAAASYPDVTMTTRETSGLTVAHGRELGRELAASAPGTFDGIVAASDLLAIGIMQSLRDVPGFSVPDDIAITGYDDNHFASEGDIPVTTVSQHGEAMGRAAAELLLRHISDPHTRPSTIVLEPDLIPRRSTLGADWHAE